VSGTASLGSTTVITGGTINGTPIGGSTPSTGAFTTVSANSGFTGGLTGNVTGNLTGNVTGNVAGNLTGNVASSGTSTFAAITMSGAIAMGTAKITGLGEPTSAQDAATKNYTDTGLALKLSLTGGTMSGAIAMGTSKITGVGDPTAAQDVATKSYVDTLLQGLDAKASCRVATTANISLSGTQTVDGIALSVGDRILVKDQSTASNNGIYLCSASTWTRTSDADTWNELPAAFVFIEVGTINANNGYVCTVPSGGTLGTTAITWTQFSGAGQITAGLGLTKTGNTIDVGTASSSRIVVNADNIDLATTGVSAATYQTVSVDIYGRVISGINPTTLAGYNISNAYTSTQVDTALGLKLNLAGGTMNGAISMGASKITGLGDPTNAQDATTKTYVDGILGSATAASTSAAAAAISATNASTSATASETSATASATSASNALSALNTFTGQYYGSLSADPTLDPLGSAMSSGDLYFNTTIGYMKVYDGASWLIAYLPASGYLALGGGTMTGAIAFASGQGFTGVLNGTLGATSPNTAVVTALTASGVVTLSGLTLSTALALDASKNIVSISNTGSGNNVLAISPTLVTPALGTPSSAVLTNATGLPISTGISGLGAGVGPFLATPSSANLSAAMTDETGSGSLVFGTSPTLVTPLLGTPTSGNLSNCTQDGTTSLGFLSIPQNSQSAAYTTVLSDSGKCIFHPSTDPNPRTFTIAANVAVAYPIGTVIQFINMTSQSVTIACNTDTLTWAQGGGVGSRTLAQYGVANVVKVGATLWLLTGTNVT
jgi:hypothetical protein